MEDECGIEELAAFLDASDEEEETTKPAKTTDKSDEIGDEDIQAFLEASDIEDEEQDGSGQVGKTAASVTQGSSQTDQTAEPEFDDMGEADLEELDQMLEAENSPETSRSTHSEGRAETADPPVKQDDAKSEMEAMAERIKQLEAMLAQKAADTKPTNQDACKSSPTATSRSAKSSQQGVTEERRDKQAANVPARGKLKQTQNKVSDEMTDDNPFFATTHHQKPVKSRSSKIIKDKITDAKKVQDKTVGSKKAQDKTVEAKTVHDKTVEAKTVQDNIVDAKTAENNVVDAKSLFGDSDDSDWDELDGGEKSQLSVEGRGLKKILNNKRVAHAPSYDPAILKKPNLKSWNETNTARAFLTTTPKPIQPEKPTLNPETGTVSGKYKLRDEYRPRTTVLQKEDERESVTDPYCGIRIINPRISMASFKEKMAGRAMIKIPRLLSKTGLTDLQKDNWVTVGVVVHKTEPRQSANGKTYCIWKLSDLENCEKTVTFFLFGNVYKEHWKNDLGVCVGLLNATLMDKAEKAQSEIAFTINHPGQMLILGISKDLGRCRGTTKAGQPCSSFINKQQGEFCTYHVQAAYRKTSSQRTELQATTGITPKAFNQKKQNNNQSGSGFFFYGGNTFSTMKPQAKSSKDHMNLQKLQNFESKKSVGKITTMSLHEMEPEDKAKLSKIKEKDKALLDLLSVPTAGAMNFVKHLIKDKDKVSTADTPNKAIHESATAKDLLKEHQVNLRHKMAAVRTLKATPTLGKGFTLGQQISLDVPVRKTSGTAAAELAKQLAIHKIKAKGGIEKEDPNAVRRKVTSPEARAKIRKRVAEDMDLDQDLSDKSPSRRKECSQPPKKKSKFLGDLDLNSPEVQGLLKSKSKHTGALAEAEAEHEEKYFAGLEHKEKLEDKMAGIMEVQVTLVVCLQCKYKYFSLSDRCKKENHPFKKVKGTKRFYKCKQCKRRTVSVEKFPTEACKDCGNRNFERVSMLKERSGPKLESEQLCLRGNEQKFVGSIQGNAYLGV